ncbi:unnamed protein product [Ectocarpus sp. 4 AP-2014]
MEAERWRRGDISDSSCSLRTSACNVYARTRFHRIRPLRHPALDRNFQSSILSHRSTRSVPGDKSVRSPMHKIARGGGYGSKDLMAFFVGGDTRNATSLVALLCHHGSLP